MDPFRPLQAAAPQLSQLPYALTNLGLALLLIFGVCLVIFRSSMRKGSVGELRRTCAQPTSC